MVSQVLLQMLHLVLFSLNTANKLLKQLQDGDIERAQLGLGHAYSRARVKFSVQKNDNHIIQAIATLDHLDKAVNNFSMSVETISYGRK